MSERTVLVRLRAEVDSYIRDLHRAGRETSAAFDRAGVASERASTQVGGVRVEVDRLGVVADRAAPKVDRVGVAIGRIGVQADSSRRQLDTVTGRLGLIVQGIAAIGPAAVPITALAVPALAGLATGLGATLAVAGTAAVALNGVGDALDAIEAARLDPTEANLAKMQETLAKLGPDGREFVRILDDARPLLRDIQNTGRAGLFPGLGAGFQDLLSRGPDVAGILFEISDAAGDLAARAGEELAGPEWDDFFTFLRDEARPNIEALGVSAGDLAAGLADVWMALDPLSDAFMRVMVEGSAAFASWAEGLEGSDQLSELLAYVQKTGPQVLDTVLAIGDAVLQIGEAAAPLGGPVLRTVEALAEALAGIADSDAGSTLLGLAAAGAVLSRTAAGVRAVGGGLDSVRTGFRKASNGAGVFVGDLRSVVSAQTAVAGQSVRVTERLEAQAAATKRVGDRLRGVGRSAGVLAGLGVAATGAADRVGLTNTAIGATTGLLAGGGPWGAAIGGGIGLLLDFADAQDAGREAASSFADTLDRQTGAFTELSRASVLDELRSRGLVEWAEDNGVALDDMISAVLQGGAALDALRDKAVGLDPLAGMGPQGAAAAAEMNKYAEAIDEVNRIVSDGVAEGEEYRAGVLGVGEAAGQTSGALGGITTRMSDFGVSLDLVADAAADAQDATSDFREEVRELSAALAGRASLRGFEQAIDDAATALRDNGRTLDETTQKGRDNADALDEIAARGLALADTLTGLSRINALERTRDQVIAAAEGFGMGEAAAARFADRVLDLDGLTATAQARFDAREAQRKIEKYEDELAELPIIVQTEIQANGIPQTIGDVRDLQRRYDLTPDDVRTLALFLDGPARDRVEGWARRLDQIDGRTVTNTVRTVFQTVGQTIGQVVENLPGFRNARGGHYPTVRAYASGGVDIRDRHRPEYAAGRGPVRVWREPETGGESYIPHANDDRRPAAKTVVEETVGLFGGRVEWYERGGGRYAPDAGQRWQRAAAPAAAGLTRTDMEAIADLVASARPTHGDIYMQPHNYSEFKRQLNADRQLDAMGGGSL